MALLTWKEMLERKDLIGRDIEAHESGYVFRGVLSEITLNEINKNIEFRTLWAAQSVGRVEKKWEACKEDSSWSVHVDYSYFSQDQDGTIEFTIPHIGSVKIYPPGDKLDPKKVKGLDPKFLESVRESKKIPS